MNTQHLDITELAERLGVSKPVIYGMRYRGEAPPAIRVGRQLRWRLEDVEAWEANRLDGGSTARRAG